MNTFTRGLKGTLRSPIKSGAIGLLFALSIALLLAMLAARTSVLQQVESVKANAGTDITITPAGVQGFMGGGDPLSEASVSKIATTDHIASTISTLSDQLGTDDTNLTSSLELGSFGQRQQRFDSSDSSSNTADEAPANMPAMTPRIQVTGTTNANSVATDGNELTISSGAIIDGTGDSLTALVGSQLAEKNSLAVGDTFTMYDQTITVAGIYTTDNSFQDSGIILPLNTLQTLTDQAGAVTSVTATADSIDNVEGIVASLESSLGDEADITSEVARAESSAASLESIAGLTLTGVIASAVVGAAIIGIGMILIVRDRRREIGVMKAIGGSNGSIVGQFITEGLAVTVAGTIVGICLGVLVSGPMTQSLVTTSSESSQTNSRSTQAGPGGTTDEGPSRGGGNRGPVGQSFDNINQSVANITATLDMSVFASAIGIVLLIAAIGSAVPAWATTRIRPAEVLRTE